MRFLILSIALISNIVLHSCTSCTRNDDVVCDSVSLQVFGVGFDTVGYESAILIRYKPDNRFDSVIDSTHYTPTYWQHDTMVIIPYAVQVQTAHSGKSPLPSGVIIPGFDYRIWFPAAGSYYSITQIVPSGQTHHVFTSHGIYSHRPYVCFNNILSCSINGSMVTTDLYSAYDSIRVVYLTR
jgi:hypothetical protein